MGTEKKTPEEKQLRMMKIQTCMIAGILVLVLIFVLFLVMKVNDVTAMLAQIDPQQINTAVESLKGAADHLSSIDMEALNKGIRGLSDAAGKMSALDFQQLADFMDSLETLGTRIDAVSEGLKGFLRLP